jgi:hypothetical protein
VLNAVGHLEEETLHTTTMNSIKTIGLSVGAMTEGLESICISNLVEFV